MGYAKPEHIARYAAEVGVKKAFLPLSRQLPLSFLAGAFVALGFLLAIRVTGNMAPEWGSFTTFIGASVFPLGLILTLIAGGELLTGNMMVVPIACLSGAVPYRRILINWFSVTIGNFVGAVFVAYAFGHVAGLTEQGPYLVKTVALAQMKLEETFMEAFVSGIGCNWLVALAVWMSYGSEEASGKMIGIWFPTMAFVAIGFQHVVANMFLIPAAIFAGRAMWGDYVHNFVPVFLGNAVGGALFVAGLYGLAYLRPISEVKKLTIRKAGISNDR